EINAIVKDLKLLKLLFKSKMESKAPAYLGLIEHQFTDKDVDNLIEHFRDPGRRKEFFKEYKEIEMLYEIISPDAFLRPYIDDYGTLSAIYDIVRKAYTKTVYVDRDFQRKTEALVRQNVGTTGVAEPGRQFVIDGRTIEVVKASKRGKASKVINLVKSIEKHAEENSDDPVLLAMADRARQIQESFESRQEDTEKLLEKLYKELEREAARKQEQAEKGFDGLTYFVYRSLLDANVNNAELVSRNIKGAFLAHPNWKQSDNALRELRKQVTFAIYAEVDDLDEVTRLVDQLFSLLERANRI
ncbi:MAG: type I restriction endonuclease subunit R, partial [Verrucomicrobiota bacterium]